MQIPLPASRDRNDDVVIRGLFGGLGLSKRHWAKAESNARKHHVSFTLAVTVFDDPYALIAPDPGHSTMEAREWIIGESDHGLLVVVFTRRHEGQVYRIISARRANRRERRLYEEFKGLSL